MLAGAVTLLAQAGPGVANGIYEDPSRLSAFLRAPMQRAVESGAIRSDSFRHEASLYALASLIPLRSRTLIRAELTFASLVVADEVEDGFGDFRVRARLPLWRGEGWVLHAVGGVRTGSGKAAVFPYATGSVDVEAGFAVVDTVMALTWWGLATGTTASRIPDFLKETAGHGNYATVGGGVSLRIGSGLHLQVGGLTHAIRKSGSRSLFFVDGEVPAGASVAFFVTAQKETGTPRDRALDYAAGVGVRVRY